MTYFDYLRSEPWTPRFTWIQHPAISARIINAFHEDFPQHVWDTENAILYFGRMDWKTIGQRFVSDIARQVHAFIFRDIAFYRNVRVRVGNHVPPHPEIVSSLMHDLDQKYKGQPMSITLCKDWYKDFLTIHPFEDGNGRTAGTILAVYSHCLEPDKGYLTPLQ